MTQPQERQNGLIARIHYQGLLRRIVGKSEECLPLPKTSVLGDLLASLMDRYGPAFAHALLTPAGELRSEVGILVDGLNPIRRGGLAYPLGEENACTVEIALLGSPPIGG